MLGFIEKVNDLSKFSGSFASDEKAIDSNDSGCDLVNIN